MGAFEDRTQLMRLVFGGMAAQMVGLVARWRLADVLGDDTRTAADLAAELGNPEHTTVRVLRAAASLGLLDEPEAGRFALTPVGALLRTDNPASAFAVARMFTDPVMTGAWQKLPDSVRTGRTTFADVFGTDFFDHLKGEPELSALFNAAMGQGTAGVAGVLPQHYDFGRFGTIMDVGGGDGTLLSAILREHPGARGVLYDTVEGSARASATFRTAGVADRVTVQTGDFFADVPGGAELYLVKSIVHDWSDDQVTTILRHCRKVIPRGRPAARPRAGAARHGRPQPAAVRLPERPEHDGERRRPRTHPRRLRAGVHPRRLHGHGRHAAAAAHHVQHHRGDPGLATRSAATSTISPTTPTVRFAYSS